LSLDRKSTVGGGKEKQGIGRKEHHGGGGGGKINAVRTTAKSRFQTHSNAEEPKKAVNQS